MLIHLKTKCKRRLNSAYCVLCSNVHTCSHLSQKYATFQSVKAPRHRFFATILRAWTALLKMDCLTARFSYNLLSESVFVSACVRAEVLMLPLPSVPSLNWDELAVTSRDVFAAYLLDISPAGKSGLHPVT